MQLLDFWQDVKAGSSTWDWNKAKSIEGEESLSSYKIHQQFFASDNVVMAPDNTYDMRDFKGFDGATVAVIPVSGPLMKSDFCGSFGTGTLSQLTKMASNATSVQAVVFMFDSPGGSVAGTETFADAIKSSGKKTIALVDDMCCSAAYWLASSCDEVYAGSNTAIVGSIGTMCSFYDSTKRMEATGVVLREYYATESTEKNKAYKDAQAGDGTALIEETLDPMNNCLMGAVQENRGDKLNKKALKGKTYVGQNAVDIGLVDGIKSFEQIVESFQNSNANSSFYMADKLSLSDIKNQYPEHVAVIATETLDNERERVGAWDAWREMDPVSVAAGIASGKAMTTADTQKLTVKATGAMKIKTIVDANAEPIETGKVDEETDAQTMSDKAELAAWRKSKGYAK